MDPHAAILDYASPRKRSRLRLPARSILTCGVSPDQILLIERLSGQGAALGAIGFACFTMLFTAGMSLTGSFGPMHRADYALPASLALLEIVVMLLLIHQTWRQTQLLVRYDQLQLTFSSPFYRRHYQWTSADIADMLLVHTANTQSEMPLAELMITRCMGGEIRLFTDHHAHEIDRLVHILPPMLRDGQPPDDGQQQHAGTGPARTASAQIAPARTAVATVTINNNLSGQVNAHAELVLEEPGVDRLLSRPGGLSYIEIPAIEPAVSAKFYQAVLGWTIETNHWSETRFTDPGGYLIGRWVALPTRGEDSGVVPYFYVANIAEAVDRAVAAGAYLVHSIRPEGNLKVARLRDPAGVLIGLWQSASA
jgi:predicted enzyme related to lactoylglutathione lyase